MPRLNSFSLKIHTGDRGLSEPVRCKFNSHIFELDNPSGSTEPNSVFEGSFEPRSFVHGFTLMGPEEGEWAIKRTDLVYQTDEGEHAISFGEVVLDTSNELNLWKSKNAASFNV